jgi:hypothetical protein
VADARIELKRGSIGPVVYVVAIPIALVVPLLALLFYVAVALLYAVTSEGARRRSSQ